ncbi:MAG TPA: ATP-binding protein [Bacteroidia bacterium]|nr:ATP-binding protein [Bacteroidia bacterium]
MTHAEEMIREQKISFPSVADNIGLVEKLVNEICGAYHISEDHYGNILVAVTEAVNNAIQHGNKLDPGKKVNLSFTANTTILSFEVTDQGEGFDFDTLPDPTNPENLEKPNGRGVFLMRHLADNVVFSDSGRTVQLDFTLQSK